MKNVSFRMVVVVLFSILTNEVAAQTVWKKELMSYINKLSKSDGGYGWEDQYDSHLTPTYAVTGILHALGILPNDRGKLAEFIRSHHPQTGPNKEAGPSGGQMRNLIFEQVQSILWLGGDVTSFIPEIGKWKSQAGVLANYETHNYAGLFQETMTPICSMLLGQKMKDPENFLRYLESCRRKNGSFNNAPAATGGDGNVLNTYWGLRAWKTLTNSEPLKQKTIAWLQDCQLENGGFTHQPAPQIGINDDVCYTWAGIKALQLLGATPVNTKAAIEYLVSLRNSDGGFGSRPGLHSTPVASYYAIDALTTLNAISALDKFPTPEPVKEVRPDFSGHKVYTVQFQASGNGSPYEAVMLADSLNIDLWGVKYAAEGWIEQAQKIADERKAGVTFFISDEPHDNKLIVPGMGSFNHVLDYIAPANATIHFSDSADFNQFSKTTLAELKKYNGGLMLQVSNNEPLARILLDESVNNFGYLAISTIHFGQNFMFWLPYLAEYRYRLPLVSLQDAHGIESWWWSNELINHRSLFIAKEPTYDGMINALKKNWVVAVRHDSISEFKTRILGGTIAARDFIKRHQPAWQWWNKNDEAIRPYGAVTILRPDDRFEAGRPQKGVSVRIRCWWNSARQFLKTPAVVMEKLEVDGKAVEPKLITVKAKNGGITDSYYIYNMKDLTSRSRTVDVYLKNIKDGSVQLIRSKIW